MKVYVFPADQHGCGHYRLIWPVEQLKREGWDVEIVLPDARDGQLSAVMDGNRVVSVDIPADADMMVFQRVTHSYVTQAIPLIAAKGVAVVIDIDDDLTCIDPRNPAYTMMHPTGPYPDHSWHNTLEACDEATFVVTSTPALQRVFARHGRGAVFHNYVCADLLEIPRVDHDMVGWAGSVHSHPGDLQLMGSSVNRLMQEGVSFGIIGAPDGVHEAWGVPQDRPLHCTGPTSVHEWGKTVAKLGIGVAPLADTRFNAAKSWLKPLEYMAVGVPSVASPRAEYGALKRLCPDGGPLLAEKPGQWYSLVKSLYQSAGLREQQSQAGRAFMRTMTIEGNAWKLGELWNTALNLERRGQRSALARRI